MFVPVIVGTLVIFRMMEPNYLATSCHYFVSDLCTGYIFFFVKNVLSQSFISFSVTISLCLILIFCYSYVMCLTIFRKCWEINLNGGFIHFMLQFSFSIFFYICVCVCVNWIETKNKHMKLISVCLFFVIAHLFFFNLVKLIGNFVATVLWLICLVGINFFFVFLGASI